MNSSFLRVLLIDWAAMACAVAVFVGVALDTPDGPASSGASAITAPAGR
jgi:hypothetical protein